MKSGNFNFLEPSGPLQFCNGTALHFTVHYEYSHSVRRNVRSDGQAECSVRRSGGMFGQTVRRNVRQDGQKEYSVRRSDGMFGQAVRRNVRQDGQTECSVGRSDGMFGQTVRRNVRSDGQTECSVRRNVFAHNTHDRFNFSARLAQKKRKK
jgi:hypothetical protein